MWWFLANECYLTFLMGRVARLSKDGPLTASHSITSEPAGKARFRNQMTQHAHRVMNPMLRFRTIPTAWIELI